MSRDRNQNTVGSPVRSRGIPLAGQTPDVSWFGRRRQGERREEEQQEERQRCRAVYQSSYLNFVGYDPMEAAPEPAHVSVELVARMVNLLDPRRPAIQDVDVNAPALMNRKGDGWEINVNVPNTMGKCLSTVNVDMSVWEDFSRQELANVLTDAINKLRERGKSHRPSAVNPGARKIAL